MFTVHKPETNRVDIRVHGRIDAEQMREGLDALVAAAEGVQDGTMLYTIDAFEMPSAGALQVEFGQLPRLFGLIGRFRRCAVLSDAAWIRSVAEVEGAVIPGLEIRGFAHDAREEAVAWLEGRGPG